jgi:hypothetical protein
MRLVAACLFSGAILISATAAGAQEIDWQKVDNAFGRKAASCPARCIGTAFRAPI